MTITFTDDPADQYYSFSPRALRSVFYRRKLYPSAEHLFQAIRFLANGSSSGRAEREKEAIADEIRSHLRYLMKLDALASKEGDQGIRWFNETGKLSAVTEQVMKVEAESLAKYVVSGFSHDFCTKRYYQLLTDFCRWS